MSLVMRLALGRIRPLVRRRRVAALLLLASCLSTAGLLAAGWFTSGPAAVGAGETLALALSPPLAFELGCLVTRRGRTAWRRTRDRRAERALRPAIPPIEQIAADLRRMLWTHDRVLRATPVETTEKRVRALEAAISASAVQAARALEVSHPDPAPYSGLETSQLRRLLRALRAEGLVLPADVGLTRPDGRF